MAFAAVFMFLDIQSPSFAISDSGKNEVVINGVSHKAWPILQNSFGKKRQYNVYIALDSEPSDEIDFFASVDYGNSLKYAYVELRFSSDYSLNYLPAGTAPKNYRLEGKVLLKEGNGTIYKLDSSVKNTATVEINDGKYHIRFSLFDPEPGSKGISGDVTGTLPVYGIVSDFRDFSNGFASFKNVAEIAGIYNLIHYLE